MRNLFQIIDAKYYNSLTSFIEDITKKNNFGVFYGSQCTAMQSLTL